MRYALYFTPPQQDPLTVTAGQWLGRDAFDGSTLKMPEVPEFSIETLMEITADPRRYGFHATLKAPFELMDGTDEAGLLAAAEKFAASVQPFEIPRMVVRQIGPYFALVPDTIYPVLQDFAAGVVEQFEPFRAPLSEADLARRNPEKLSESQRANLMRWGYHHVMEDFRFHMTLTGRVDPALAPSVMPVLQQRFADFIDRPLAVAALAIFIEPARGAPFTVHSLLPLGETQA